MPRDLESLRKLVRDHALSMPQATEDFPWGESVAKVGGKVFVFMGKPKGSDEVSFAVKLPESGREALGMAFTAPTAYGLGTKGWVTATISGSKRPPEALLLAWIEESWRAVAPKRLVAQHAAGAAPAAPAKPKAARKKATAKAPRPKTATKKKTSSRARR